MSKEFEFPQIISSRKEPCVIFCKEKKTDPLNENSLSFYHFDIYITGDLDHATNYVDAVQTLRNMEMVDECTIHLNSPGGDLISAIQIIAAMKASKGKIRCNVEGLCLSAATLIFFAAKEVNVEDNSVFLFHTYSANLNMKKSHEINAQVVHDIEWVKELLQKTYTGFLSQSEISSILEGKDIWMHTDEVKKRYNKMRKSAKASK